jgi:glucose/arabinose dehydrogenase
VSAPRAPKTARLALALAATSCGGSHDGPKDAAPADAGPPDAYVLPPCRSPVAGTQITLRKLADTAGGATLVTSPPNDPRQFLLEQSGVIRIFQDDAFRPRAFLDLSAGGGGFILAGGEQGLLGLAFHPKYATNGQFFIYYTTRVPGNVLRDVVSRCSASADPDVASPTCTELFSIVDFAASHNGGMLEFGPDGLLYVSTGDGGGQGDTTNTAQNPNNLLGKILRVDIDNKAPGREYGIPADNPFAAGGGKPEVFILGLRNPWRWSFDRATGDMWIADVGQNTIEELTVLPPAQQKGANLGWSMYEGTTCFKPPCSPAGKTFPQFTHPHGPPDNWTAIIGGEVYRGTCYPDLVGQYLFTDYEGGGLYRARFANNAITVEPIPGTFPKGVSSLHADSRGEIYVTTAPADGNGTDGAVYHLEAGP